MKTFAISTSSNTQISIAINEYNIIRDVKNRHSDMLCDITNEILEDTSTKLSDIDNVIISRGPGSFTGIRVSMAFIKGLFNDTKTKIFELTEFEAYKYKVKDMDYDVLIILIDGQKEKVYVNIYDKQKDEYLVSSINEIIDICNKKYINKKVLIIGNAMLRHKEKITSNIKCNIIENDKNNIDVSVYIEMLENNMVEEVSTRTLKPYYLEKMEVNKK